ncbi:MAG: hypothetical protein WA294_21680 [Acidobacteriaceae bacterium]
MAFDLSVAGKSLSTDPNVIKDLRNDKDLAFGLDATLSALLDSPLSGVPASASSSKISFTSPDASWKPGDITFGLSGGATGKFDIVLTGDLVPYMDGLDDPKKKSIPVPPHTAYTRLTLSFSLSLKVSGSGSFSGGAFGVKGSADAKTTYAVTFCKVFDPSVLVKDAITQTFQGWVFPLHPNTLANLANGDYLLYEFDGSLNLSFGAFTGINNVLYAGQSCIDVLSVKGSPLATLVPKARPDIRAGAELDFSFQYASTFEALLSRLGTTGTMHLFRSDKATTTTSVMTGLTFNAGVSARVGAKVQTVQSSLVDAAGGSTTKAGQALNQIVTSSDGVAAIKSGIGEINGNIADWLNRANGFKANLQVAIETVNARTILAAYDFDTTAANFGTAWNAAINGDFSAALASGAVTLEIGSGLENEYQRKCSFTINLFNLWKFSDWDQYSQSVSMVYAGNGVYHLLANIGRTQETDATGTMHSINFYFAASADTISGSSQVASPQAELHIDLTAQKNAHAAQQIAALLRAVGGGPACDKIAQNMQSFATAAPHGTVQLQITVSPAAYQQIRCDTYVNHKPPAATVFDPINWQAFVNASDTLNAWALRNFSGAGANLAYFKSYNAWELMNQELNGGSEPNRTEFPMATGWPQDFPQVDGTNDQVIIIQSMLGAQSFLNVCAGLVELTAVTDVGAVPTTWNNLLGLINNVVKSFAVADFVRPTTLAILTLCNSAVNSVSGPANADAATGTFAVKLSL